MKQVAKKSVGRPKADATLLKEAQKRIRELETRVLELQADYKAAENVANEAREKPLKMGGLFFDIWIIARHINEKFYEIDEGLLVAQLRAIEAMADRGSELGS